MVISILLREDLDEIFNYGRSPRLLLPDIEDELLASIKRDEEILQVYRKGKEVIPTSFFFWKHEREYYYAHIFTVERAKKEEISLKIARFSIKMQQIMNRKDPNKESSLERVHYSEKDIYLVQLLSSSKMIHENIQTPSKIEQVEGGYNLFFDEDGWEEFKNLDGTTDANQIKQIIKGLVRLEKMREHWRIHILLDLDNCLIRKGKEIKISLKRAHVHITFLCNAHDFINCKILSKLGLKDQNAIEECTSTLKSERAKNIYPLASTISNVNLSNTMTIAKVFNAFVTQFWEKSAIKTFREDHINRNKEKELFLKMWWRVSLV
eukprot:TRINITY_DN594_c0_g1_i3.p1 TRINITY_DN594_c0_g1~~TRINITY_DN594_c0_g1_i3.p1  ORF type:complete len:322 (+),score=67.95 TRINITY_DN594_c0_g1_i3:1023-1988(+)